MATALHGVSHLGIAVSDLDRSVAFYTEVLGLELVDRYGYDVPNPPEGVTAWWREVAVLRIGHEPTDPVIVMSPHDTSNPPHRMEIDDVGTHHFGMQVAGIEAIVERVVAAGVEISVPLRTYQSARAWGLPGTFVMKSCIFRDPDGTMIQLDEPVETAS